MLARFIETNGGEANRIGLSREASSAASTLRPEGHRVPNIVVGPPASHGRRRRPTHVVIIIVICAHVLFGVSSLRFLVLLVLFVCFLKSLRVELKTMGGN